VVGCWLGHLSGVRCRLAYGHCHSLSLASVKSRLVLPFWYRLTQVVLDKGSLNGCVCGYVLLLSNVRGCIGACRSCHCHSLSLASVKSRLVLPFWYRLTQVVPDKGSLNGCVCGYVLLLCNVRGCIGACRSFTGHVF